MRLLAKQIATVGGIGLIPFAPGTFGTLAALPMFWCVHWLGGFAAVVVATMGICAVGYWASAVYLDGRMDDPSEVVIDEVAGMFVTLWPLSAVMTYQGTDPAAFPWPAYVGGFIVFRFFDIVKPPPVNWADKPGPFGVMFDDVVAGVLAALVLFISAGVAHGWF